jgi:hypothetical protein
MEKKYAFLPFYVRGIQLLIRFALKSKIVKLPEAVEEKQIPEEEDEWEDLSNSEDEFDLSEEYDDINDVRESDPSKDMNLGDLFQQAIKSFPSISPELVKTCFSTKEMQVLSMIL